jgi:3-oxoacyl-[acyl-carrier protein] reductase
MSSLQDKIVIITGGTRGIGFGAAKLFVAEGAKVILAYSKDTKAAGEAVEALGSDKAEAYKADIADLKQIKQLVEHVASKYGRIDVLVNNAGILWSNSVTTAPEEEFDKFINVNLKSPFFFIQYAVPHMPAGGRIILVSTSLTSASAVRPDYSLYLASKGGIEQLVRTSAKELGARGININVVCPGPTETDMLLSNNAPEALQMMRNLTPSKKLGQPEHIANVFLMLAGPAGDWINGERIRVNGGLFV